MAKYQRYVEYRNTHNQWLTEIPNHWSLVALKHILSVPMTDGPHETPDFLDEGVPFVSAEAVSSGKIDFKKIRGFITEADDKRFSQKYKPQLHDVYMIKSGATTGVTAIVETEDDFNIWSPLAAMRCKKSYDPFFLLNYLRSDPFQKSVQLSWTFGTQQNIGMSTLENLPVCVPPRLEQKKIADFLNYETAKIDSLIEKQQQLIQLLKEKRQAVISHAVTKGLNPDVPMKNSGVEWLGQVPEHWIVLGFKKYLESIVDYRGKTPEKVDEGVFLVTARNIKNGQIDYALSQEFVAKKDYEQIMSRGKPILKDVLFTTEAPLGEVAQIDNVDIALAQRIIKFRGKENVLDNTYLKYFIVSQQFQDSLMTFATGSTALGIKAERLGYLKIAIPPLIEQYKIVEYLEIYLLKNKSLIQKAQAAIQLMQERRTALISAAVTGKIDVRNWQNPTEAKMEFSA